MPGRSKGRCSQAARLFAIVERLRTSRLPVRIVALADEQHVTKRQVARDLLALEEAGCILDYTLVDEEVGGIAAMRAAVRLADKRYAQALPTTRFHDPCGARPCPGNLRVIVHVSAARAAEIAARTFHPTQHVEQLPEGGVTLRWHLCDLTDVVPWVLSLGSHARVLGPEELVEHVAADLRRAAAHYTAGRPKVTR